MKQRMKKLLLEVSALFLILFAFPKTFCSFAQSEGAEEALYVQFLKNHPEYQYAGLIDLDEDGRDELLIARFLNVLQRFNGESGFESISLVVPSNGELLIYSLNSRYSFIAYDRENHALVGTTGGTDAFADILLTMDSGNVYEWWVGYGPGFTPDGNMYYKYNRTLYRALPDKDGFPDSIHLYTEPIDEAMMLEYKTWFYSLSPILLGARDSLSNVLTFLINRRSDVYSQSDANCFCRRTAYGSSAQGWISCRCRRE